MGKKREEETLNIILKWEKSKFKKKWEKNLNFKKMGEKTKFQKKRGKI